MNIPTYFRYVFVAVGLTVTPQLDMSQITAVAYLEAFIRIHTATRQSLDWTASCVMSTIFASLTQHDDVTFHSRGALQGSAGLDTLQYDCPTTYWVARQRASDTW